MPLCPIDISRRPFSSLDDPLESKICFPETRPTSGHFKVVLIAFILFSKWDCRFFGLTLLSSPQIVHGQYVVRWGLLL